MGQAAAPSHRRRSCYAAALLLVLAFTFAPAAYFVVTTGAPVQREALRKIGWRILLPWIQWRWQVAEAAKLRMPKYQLPASLRANASSLPVYAVTLPRLTERHDHMRACMAPLGGNVSFQFFWGLDGRDGLPDAWVKQYSGPATQGRLTAAASSQHSALALACKLSHVAIMHAVLAAHHPLAVVLEDDACISRKERWHERLVAALRSLPDDWDLLYLWGHGGERGSTVADGVRVVRKMASTTCYVVRDRGAMKILNLVQGTDNPIDKVLFHLESGHLIQAYVTEPDLCEHDPPKQKSTLDYEGAAVKQQPGSSSAAAGRLLHGLQRDVPQARDANPHGPDEGLQVVAAGSALLARPARVVCGSDQGAVMT